jgi:hypothetical protein
MILYKYLPPSRLDVLETGRIRFTQPIALNDPFECMPCFTKFKRSLLARVDRSVANKTGITPSRIMRSELQDVVEKGLLTIPEVMSKYFALLCLSGVRNNLLMWSHYTVSHQGFVLGFDSLSPFFQAASGSKLGGLRRVNYSNTRYKVRLAKFKSLDDPEFIRSRTAFFFTKSAAWKHEREFKLVASPQAANVTLTCPGGHDIHLYDFPSNSVREVILGHRMSPTLRSSICEIVKQKYHSAQLFRAVLDETRFQLRIVRIPTR